MVFGQSRVLSLGLKAHLRITGVHRIFGRLGLMSPLKWGLVSDTKSTLFCSLTLLVIKTDAPRRSSVCQHANSINVCVAPLLCPEIKNE